MGKSKSGGTRSFLRGRVGSDVYSIGKDAKGNKQQVVRSLAEQVANPQTAAQMRGRMIMATIMQAVAAMRPIVDHSFDSVPAGQPNISRYISLNYALLKVDVAAHPAQDNVFGLNKYGEKGIKLGAYQVSEGQAEGIKGAVINGTAKTITIALGADVTIGGLRSALGLAAGDYFTLVSIAAAGQFVYNRFHINESLSADTTITSSNVGSVFNMDGNVNVTVTLSGSNIVATFAAMSANAGIIVSRKQNDGFKHSTVVLAAPSAPDYTADVALPTYPIGQARFLNGGGDSEVSPFSPEPTPTEETAEISGATLNGSDLTEGSTTNLPDSGSSTIVMTIATPVAGRQYNMALYNSKTSSLSLKTAISGTTGTMQLDNTQFTSQQTLDIVLLGLNDEVIDTWSKVKGSYDPEP